MTASYNPLSSSFVHTAPIVRPKPKPKPKPVVTAHPAATAGALDLRTQARQSVDAQIASAIKGMQSPIKAEQAQAREQAQRAQDYMLALHDLTADDPEQIRQAYASAADQMKGLGTGLTGAVFDAQQQASQQAADDIARLTGGVNTVGAGVDPAAAKNALLYQGVVMPGRTFGEQAASAFTGAKTQALVGDLGVEQIAQDYLRRGTDLQKTLAQKVTDLQASRPELYQKALSGLTDASRQQRALDVQIGTLQLQQAKTAQEQAVAMTNLTGTVHVVQGVGPKAHVVDTHQPAMGSDAAQIAAANARTELTVKGQNARAAADRRVRKEIEDAANATRLTAAQTAAEATKAAAGIRAAATKAAAQVKAQAARNKPPNPKQRSDILSGARKAGLDMVAKRIANVEKNIPNSGPQGPNESDAVYEARKQKALAVRRARLQEHRREFVDAVAQLITPQLQLLKYGPDQINGYADSIVNAYIGSWVGLKH